MTSAPIETGPLKVFISWSGALSKAIAAQWHDLIDKTFDGVEPWMSDKNIELGTRPLNEIAGELRGSKFGIVVVTRDNQNSQWLSYESGALSRDVEKSSVRLVPCLVDFDSPADLTGPLSQFQAGLLDDEMVERTLQQVAKAVGVNWSRKADDFRVLWNNKYRALFDAARKSVTTTPPPQTAANEGVGVETKINELLTLVRSARNEDQQRVGDAAVVREQVISDMSNRFRAAHGVHVRREVHLGGAPYGSIVYILKDGQSFADGHLETLRNALQLIHSTPVAFMTMDQFLASPMIPDTVKNTMTGQHR